MSATPTILSIERYTPEAAAEWDAFVDLAKNGVFLFRRGYMDYHADRFHDHSLMFRGADRKLLALLPGCDRPNGVFASHAGLTFGGVISDRRMKVATMVDLFEVLKVYLRDRQMSTLVYKAVPHIYHRVPAEEDLYALTLNGARLVRRDVSTTIDLRDRIEYTKGRKWSTNKAHAAGIEVIESRDFRGFMAIESAHLQARFGVNPTHSGDEMELLASRFPDNIRLFMSRHEERPIGGMIIYQSAKVAHAQYIAATDEGRTLGNLDAIMAHLLGNNVCDQQAYFDFGISTTENGMVLNRGLADNKESYGGRAVVYDSYEWTIN